MLKAEARYIKSKHLWSKFGYVSMNSISDLDFIAHATAVQLF